MSGWRWKRRLAPAMLLALWLTSGCSLRSPTRTPAWPIADCPGPVVLPHAPIAVTVTLEDDSTVVVTALTPEAWVVLLGYLAELRECAEQRGLTLKAVNDARP